MEHSKLYHAIFHRKSIRKYKMTPLNTDIILELKNYVRNIKYLDDSIKIELSYLTTADVKNLLPIKAPHYICLYSQEKDGYLMNTGFVLQQIDLYLSAKGIGSCWLGLAKPSSQVSKQKNGLNFVIMLAFGHSEEPTNRSEILEFKRKNLEQISAASKMDELLNPVRLAPSATNSQPWFFTGDGNEIHLHRVKLNRIKVPIYGKMNQIDMGIAACHLYLSAIHHHKHIQFISKEINADKIPKGYQYMISAQLNKN